jgi:hypothetical protein
MSNSVGLSAEEWLQWYALEASLMEIYKGEEEFWWQWSHQNWLLQGDANTTYYHAIANGTRQKCSFPCLWDQDDLLEDARDISNHIYSFYKVLLLLGDGARKELWRIVDVGAVSPCAW